MPRICVRGKSEAGHGGIVAAVNDVVRDAGWLGCSSKSLSRMATGRFGW